MGSTLDSAMCSGFGENILVEGLAATDFCIGDVWATSECADRRVELQVCTPRRPCTKFKKKHGVGPGMNNLWGHCLRTGLGGWFCRVVRSGELRYGDRLICIRRVHPDWPVNRVSAVVYGLAD